MAGFRDPYIDMESFIEFPRNWREIAEFLNNLLNETLEEKGIDLWDELGLCVPEAFEVMNDIWEDYWSGNIPDAPIAIPDE